MPFAFGFQIAIRSILLSCARHDEEVEGKVDVLFDQDKAKETSSNRINTVSEFGSEANLISAQCKNLIYFSD